MKYADNDKVENLYELALFNSYYEEDVILYLSYGLNSKILNSQILYN